MLSHWSSMLRQFVRPMGRVTVSRQVLNRTFASKSVVPPVQLFGLDGTYASALYIAAGKDSSIDATEKTLKNLEQLFSKDPEAKRILTDPSLEPQAKSAVIEEIVKATSGDKVFSGFLETLAQNGRLELIDDVISQFGILTNAYKGIVEAEVVSATPLDAKALKRVEKALQGSEYVGSNKTLQLKNTVSPSIKGGLVVTIGDRTADLSVASKVQKYNALLSESI